MEKNREIIEKMRQLRGEAKKYTPAKIGELADELVEFMATDGIWLKDFAIKNGFSAQRISEFAEKNTKFANALAMAKDIQESKIFKGALGNKLNSTMAIFALKNIAGWKDKQPEEEDPKGNTFNQFNFVTEKDWLPQTDQSKMLQALTSSSGIVKIDKE